MASDRPKVPRPGNLRPPLVPRTNQILEPSVNGAIKREPKPAVQAFQPSRYDEIYPAGEIINVDANERAAYIVRQGSLEVEMQISTPQGLKHVQLGTIEAGEYFSIHTMFGFPAEDDMRLQYRAQSQVIIMPVTLGMLPRENDKLRIIFRSFMQTAARQEAKLRKLAAYALQRAEDRRIEKSGINPKLLDTMREDLEEKERELSSLRQRLQESVSSRLMPQHDTESIRLKHLKLQQEYEALNLRFIELQNKNNALSQALKIVQDENHNLAQKIRRHTNPPSVDASRFPSASRLLVSDELHKLESEARHFQELSRKMHRAMELLSEDNPGLKISEDVIHLLVGEEPPEERQSVHAQRAIKKRSQTDIHIASLIDQIDQSTPTPQVAESTPKTSHSASQQPWRLPLSQKTPRPGDHQTSAQQAAQPEQSIELNMDSRSRIASKDPSIAKSLQPPSVPVPQTINRDSDRQITSRDTPEARHTNSQNISAVKATGHQSFLNQDDMNSILQDFVNSIPDEPALRPPAISAPYPWQQENQTQNTSAEWDLNEPSTGSSRQTQPYCPGHDQLPTAAEIDMPSDPPTPRLHSPQDTQTVTQGARHSSELEPHFSAHEPNSDVTPVVPSKPPASKPFDHRQTRAYSEAFNNQSSARAIPPPPRQPTPFPRNAVTIEAEPPAFPFMEEDTDVRQILEDFRRNPIVPRTFKPESTPGQPIVVPPVSVKAKDDLSWMDDSENNTTREYSSPGGPKKPKP